ncbi:hypothetical protein HII17_12300 [Thalassotalea sp. M1531]|uniref:Chloramphenicol acetyltransferase n=1 Tax=Thalassotalea algicola TaxID=2716224 RepID=A0A7Y0Q6T5_9GAMM|nr:CatA-like O-acetyltransferase [Thalassotalea algicola]NMP32344.1 hypothetical protein [Thalassotalea algicola]
MVNRYIDLTTWHRKNHFEFYKGFEQPCFNICLTIDVTEAIKFANKHNVSKLFTLLYLSSKACNNVEAFKLRISASGKPYKLNKVHPSATLMNNEELFSFCNFKFDEDFENFIHESNKNKLHELAKPALSEVENREDLIFYSIIPWLSFTSFSHAQSKECQDIPKIVFGKFNYQQDKITMPISVELHHALADGLDVAKYIQAFENEISTCHEIKL